VRQDLEQREVVAAVHLRFELLAGNDLHARKLQEVSRGQRP
jgi:hypothetical protein